MCSAVRQSSHSPLISFRYIGEGYSQAQETMEDEMREFYGPGKGKATALTSPSSGQLVAVRTEEEEEILRAQVCEVMADKVKVRGLKGHLGYKQVGLSKL